MCGTSVKRQTLVLTPSGSQFPFFVNLINVDQVPVWCLVECAALP